MKNKVKAPVAVITGASSGIGAQLARELHHQGYKVFALARRLEKLSQLQKELGSEAFDFCQADVTDESSLRMARDRALQRFKKIDMVIANAGIGVTGPFESLHNADFTRQFQTNIFGVLNTIRVFLPALKSTRGHLGVVGSVAGIVSSPFDSPYSMSKSAIRALCDTLSMEFANCGVGVTHIAPGFVESEIRLKNGKDPIPSWLVVPTERAARSIVRALAKRKREHIVTFHGKVFVFLRRYFPGLVFFLARRLVPRFRLPAL